MHLRFVAPTIAFSGFLSLALFGSLPAGAEPAVKPSWTETPNGVTTFFGTTGAVTPSKKGDGAAELPAFATPAMSAVSDPVLKSAIEALSSKAVTARADGGDVEALKAFLSKRSAPLWVEKGSFNAKAKAVISELAKADDWGLKSSDYEVAPIGAGASPEALGEAEAKLSLAALRYASHARGGRIDPLSISNIWDMKPPLKAPGDVLDALAAKSDAAGYLVSLQPKHAGFLKLKEALHKARGPKQVEQIDEALTVKLPSSSKTLKPGEEHADVALLRKRLKIEAQSTANESLYDARLEAAVRQFQEEKGLKANGQLNAKTRQALNAESEPKKAGPKDTEDLIISNMERWRWLPENLGELHVMNNIPEFVGRVRKGDETIWEERIIIGQTTWPTPILTASMNSVVFRPTWGVPDGIKVKELLPRLRRAGGGGFFDQLFGGGSSGGARVLAAYGLKPSYNGRPVDPNSVDWSNVDIRRFDFIQPAGGQNPLGDVKFMFPNRHDVYMHDTTQRALFAQSFRALSHGCIRVQNPRKLAYVLLNADKGWSEERVSSAFASGGEVGLEKPIPVYLTYFTARVDNNGKLQTYADFYGNDRRVLSALAGRPVRYEAPERSGDDLVADASDEGYVPAAASNGKKQTNKKQAQQVRQKGPSNNDLLSDLLSGLVAN